MLSFFLINAAYRIYLSLVIAPFSAQNEKGAIVIVLFFIFMLIKTRIC
jgi:hypothetical protein